MIKKLRTINDGSLFLKQISVEGFRGINNQGEPLSLDFDPAKVNSIYAVNGHGKSSLFEAIQFALTGQVAKLARMQAAEQPENYYNNLFHTGNAVIELNFGPDDASAAIIIRVERTKDGTRQVSSPSGHNDPEDFLAAISSELVLLDYRTFEKFVEESPLKRGRSFAHLVGLSELSELRQATEAMANPTTVERDLGIDHLTFELGRTTNDGRDAAARIRDQYEALIGTCPIEPLDHDAISESAVGALRAIGLLAPILVEDKLEDIDFDVVGKTIAGAEGAESRTELTETITALTSLLRLNPNPDPCTV